MTGEKPQPIQSVQTIQRACAIMRCFVENDNELGVTSISRQVGIHKSTVSRLLSALSKENLVEQNPKTGKWRLGFGLLDLAGALLEDMDWLRVSIGPMRRLSQQTQETVNITVLDGNQCVNIVSIPSSKAIQHVGRLGRRTPLHCTSTGKVLLSFLSTEEQDALLSDHLEPCTEDSIVDKSHLARVLEEVREQGYATAIDEYEAGLSAIAAPVYNHLGEVVAAISISGPSYRMGLEEIKGLVVKLKSTANEISALLGHLSPSKVTRIN